MKKIIRLTENDLHRIIENSVKRIIKENQNNDYGLISTNNKGKEGFKLMKLYHEMTQKLLNNETVMYKLPINFDKTFNVTITPMQNKTFSIETNYGTKTQVGVNNTFTYVNQLYQNVLNKENKNN